MGALEIFARNQDLSTLTLASINGEFRSRDGSLFKEVKSAT